VTDYETVRRLQRAERRRKFWGILLAAAFSVGLWALLYKAVILLGEGW